jgi:NarL family two-component system response regulator LiaR
MIRVLIADDYELAREGIALALGSHPEIEVVGCAEDGREAVERARELGPDIVVLDLRMAGHGGMEALDAFSTELPDTRVLVLTANENPDNARAAIEAGAAGFLTKQTSGDELCEAVLAVARGGLVIPPSLSEPLAPGGSPGLSPELVAQPTLSARQRAIVRHLSMGLTDQEIADRLYVSVRTVQYELSEVRSKTGLARRSEIARWAVIHSLG